VSVFVENLACRRMTVGGLLMRVGDAGLSKQQAASSKQPAARLNDKQVAKMNSHHYNSATNPHTELQREHHPLTPCIRSASQSTLARVRGVGYRQRTAPSQSPTLGAHSLLQPVLSIVLLAVPELVGWCLTVPQLCV
jgi:hypothetical protein